MCRMALLSDRNVQGQLTRMLIIFTFEAVFEAVLALALSAERVPKLGYARPFTRKALVHTLKVL